jgi:pyruvate dehydrogenase E2 component (dihydrolipoamide acetyltransferase)
MATEITMPKLSDTMTEGTLVAWKKSVGDKVERGDIIAEVETDKATMELEAFSSGVLLEVRIKPGETAPVGTVIALVGKEGEKSAGGERGTTEKEKPEKGPEKPKEEKEEAAAGTKPDKERTEPEGEHGPAEEKEPEGEAAPRKEEAPAKSQAPSAETEELPKEEPKKAEEEPAKESGEGAKASPLVRRLAREKGVDLERVKGSGPDGRIVQEDLEGFLAKQAEAEVNVEEKPGKAEPLKPAAEGAAKPLSRMRAAIAKTVSLAWQTIPHFAVTVAVDMGEAERVRQELKESGAQLSLNDLIVKAAATAIGKFPLVNASFGGDSIIPHAEVNIGIAVALDDGLLVPVIKGCQGLSLKEIAVKSRDLVEKVRAGKISEAEIGGGTFSVSNLGMYGVEEFTAVILPPQGAILSVGAVADQPVIKEGHLTAARIMRATLSADHRLIDGAYAAQFLRELKRVLENPVTMLV